MTGKRRKVKSSAAAGGLAAASVVLVLVALVAAFTSPATSKTAGGAAGKGRALVVHPPPSAYHNPVPIDSASPLHVVPAVDPAPPAPAPSPAPAPAGASPAPTPAGGGSPAGVACHPLTSTGHCYEPGEFCRVADHGKTGLAGNGQPIVCNFVNGWHWVVGSKPVPSPVPPAPGADLPAVLPLAQPIQGVVTPDVPAWNKMTGTSAELAVSYVSMAQPLAPSFLHSAMRVAAGATPVIEMTPSAFGQQPLSLTQIAAGQADTWLNDLRQQIGTLGRPVILSFAPEPNGTWYQWGTQPAAFVTAWDHVHAVIGTGNVTWMWQPSAVNPGGSFNALHKLITDDMKAYWPGPGEVDWVGLDGYYYTPADTFHSRFAGALGELSGTLGWHGPVIIGETAVSPFTGKSEVAPDPAKITDLFAGVAAARLLGLIYFDLKPACPPQCQQDGIPRDFRLEKYPAALAAYVKAVHGPW